MLTRPLITALARQLSRSFAGTAQPTPLWNPLDMATPPVVWYDVAAGRNYTTAAGFTKASNGQAVAAICDLAGERRLTGTYGPTLSATGGPDGGPCLTFNGTTNRLELDADLIGPQVTVYILVKPLTFTNGAVLVDTGNSGARAVLFQANPTPNVTNAYRNTATLTLNEWRVVCLTAGPNYSSVKLNGAAMIESAAAYTPSMTKLVIGSTGASAGYTSSAVAAIAMFNGIHDEATQTAFMENMLARSFVVPAFKKQLFAAGNSITYGQGATVSYPSQLLSLLGSSKYTLINCGHSGQNTQYMIDHAVAEIDNASNPDTQRIVVAMEGRNQMAITGSTPAQAESLMAAFCSARKAAGAKVYVATCPPSAGLTEANWSSYNNLLRSNWTNYANGLIDHELLDPSIGAWGAHLNSSLFPDQVHPNDAGAAKLAANVYSVLT